MSNSSRPLVADHVTAEDPGQRLTPAELDRWLSRPARQQPCWSSPDLLREVREDLGGLPGLVTASSVGRLRALLGEVSAGRMRVVQAGDCAEDPDECTEEHVRAKVGMLDRLAEVMLAHSGRPVLRIGRLAGQFSKPRSQPTERIGDLELPAYRGPMVNGPAPDPVTRIPDPLRLVAGYHLSHAVLGHLAGQRRGADGPAEAAVWTSHEALLLDYELPLLRRLANGDLVLTSTHLPWIGDRTRQVDGAHVALLASVVNPVACKVGPGTTVAELLRLCEVLDPRREPGRLTLIARFGAELVYDALPPLVRAVRQAGHPVLWLCDPMHGNTVRGPDGRKTRYVSALVRELEEFQDLLLAEHGVAGGVHLEATPQYVGECRWHEDDRSDGPYTTLCDPRLNLHQAVDVVSAWWA